MLTEHVTITAIEADGILVEARRQSQCGSCSASKGCGHRLLESIHGNQRRHLKVPLNDSAELASLNTGDIVTIGIDERQVLRSALLLYLLPLGLMILSVGLATFFELNEAGMILAAIIGLAAGFRLLQRPALHQHLPAGMQPQFLGKSPAASVLPDKIMMQEV